MLFWKIYFVLFSLLFICNFVFEIHSRLTQKHVLPAIRVILRHLFLAPVLTALYLFAFGKEWLDVLIWRVYFFIVMADAIRRIRSKKQFRIMEKLKREQKQDPLMFLLAAAVFLPVFIALFMYAFLKR